MTADPIAFMSYAQFNDNHDRGWLTAFRERLSGEVETLTGAPFPIFQDRHSLEWGDHWKTRIEQSIDAVALFIPVVTPHFFASPACRDELSRFLANERRRGREDLILPLYYVTADKLQDTGLREADQDANLLYDRQYHDLRNLRGERPHSDAFDAGVRKAAKRLHHAFTQRSAAGPGPTEGVAAAARQPTAAPEEPSDHGIGTWDGLARVLRNTDFDDSDWTALASSAAPLIAQLALLRPPHPFADDVLADYITTLERTLDSASSPSVDQVLLRSACAYAAKVRGWMLQVLTSRPHP